MRRTRLRETRRIGGRGERPDGRLMQLDVVGVAVAAELVVADHDLGPMLADRRNDLRGHLFERGLHQAVGVLIVGRAGHAAVAIAEPIDAPQVKLLRGAT